MKGREPRIAGRAVEEDHVSHDALGIKHTGQKVTTELTVQLGCSSRGVGAVNAELAFQFVG